MNNRFGLLLGRAVVRLSSVVAGILVLKHEVYDSDSAEIIVIALGMWLIGVPPALWLDAFRTATKKLDVLESDTDAQTPRPDPEDRDGREG